MLRNPIVCPNCGAVYDPEAVLKTRRGRVVAAPVAEKKPAKEIDPEAAEIDVEVEVGEPGDEETDEELIEDTSELGEDEDVAQVIEKVEDEER
jgi:uncharacterized protein (TIGR02300 family)